jgi:hypothetical protein
VQLTTRNKGQHVWKDGREVPLDQLGAALADVPDARRAAERADRSITATVLAFGVGASGMATAGQVALGTALLDRFRPGEQRVLLDVALGSLAAGSLAAVLAAFVSQQQLRRAVDRYNQERCR